MGSSFLEATPDLPDECFFIAPIGEDGSPLRSRSDGIQALVVEEAAASHGLRTQRADKFGEPGEITSQIVRHCLGARMCVADLSFGNPNVYYELSVRHGAALPIVLIAENGTELPFDVGKSRVIFFDSTSFSSGIQARESVREQIGTALASDLPADNPIMNGFRLAELHRGTAENDALAVVLERLERVTVATAEIESRLRKAERREAVRQALQNQIDQFPKQLDQYAYLTEWARVADEKLADSAGADLSAGVEDDSPSQDDEIPD